MRIKINIHPPGGRYFQERDGTKHRSGSWRGVIKKVRQYRKMNGFKEGDVESEVMIQACQRHPTLCYDDSNRIAPPRSPDASLKVRVLQWLSKIAKLTPVFVPVQEAAERVETCLKCPKMREIAGGCGSCKAALKEFQKNILKGRKSHDQLAGCEVLGVDLKVAVHISDSRVVDPELPEYCWRKAKG